MNRERKILEEIDREKEELTKTDFGDEYNAGIKDMAEISKKIIHKHLSLENAPENTRLSQGNDVWILAEEKPTKDGFYQATISGTLVGKEEPFVGLALFKEGDEKEWQRMN